MVKFCNQYNHFVYIISPCKTCSSQAQILRWFIRVVSLMSHRTTCIHHTNHIVLTIIIPPSHTGHHSARVCMWLSARRLFTDCVQFLMPPPMRRSVQHQLPTEVDASRPKTLRHLRHDNDAPPRSCSFTEHQTHAHTLAYVPLFNLVSDRCISLQTRAYINVTYCGNESVTATAKTRVFHWPSAPTPNDTQEPAS